jgi:flagellar biosynthesis/type III secretory pathway chaperone
MQELLVVLEDHLVKEFRMLQSLITLSKNERVCLRNRDTSQLLRVVEEKEALLDTIGLLMDSERMTIQKISEEVGLKSDTYSLVKLFPYFALEQRKRLKNLHEGISTLVDQAKELSLGNRAMADTNAQILDATQAYLLRLIMPPANYQHHPAATNAFLPPVWGVEHAV